MLTKKTRLFAAILAMLFMPGTLMAKLTLTQNPEAQAQPDTTVVLAKQKNSFWKSIGKPFKWIGKNWSAYDPAYSTPSFYNWVGQLQNNFSKEWLNMYVDEDIDLTMQSKLSSKFGPYLGYSFLGYGYSIDLAALKGGTDRRNEFTLSINSNLVNIDLIRRRTGGDFTINKLRAVEFDFLGFTYDWVDRTDFARQFNLGEFIKYDITGININYFTNHKKYSNPAAFSNGAIQLRSVGSPIIGFGYTRQKVDNTMADLFETMTFYEIESRILEQENGKQMRDMMLSSLKQKFPGDYKDVTELRHYMTSLYDNGDVAKYKSMVKTLITNDAIQPLLFGPKDFSDPSTLYGLLTTAPSLMTIDDWHLQLGYAYNLVFSRRLLLGLSFVASPGIKRINATNNRNMTYIAKEEFTDAVNHYYNFTEEDYVTPDVFCSDYKTTATSIDFFGRASLTYNFNRWRAGVNANVNAFLYRNDQAHVNSYYGSANVYVGYCFGRKKQYRYDGKDRQAYIMAALTPRQIEEMKDTLPASNIAHGMSYLAQEGSTTYHTDHFNLDIEGCDLVQGADGKYGTFEIQDGYVTPGEDTEGRLKPGTVLDINADGDFYVTAGHKAGFRAGNWWKSQLSRRQIPTNWYPEMLHYALRGKLTLNVRSHTFGTKKPVQVVIDDFCINHGNETKEFYQIGAKSFFSHSSYSIIGHVNVNGRKCRVYIESKKRGKHNIVYINPMKKSKFTWMSRIPDDRAISRISMPGSHDAGTASLPEGSITSTAHTQNFTITEQLEDGLRCFDIRLKKNMKYGHTLEARDGYDETLVDIRKFLEENPSEFIVAMIGSDEGGKWSDEMKANYRKLHNEYKDLMIDNFDAHTPIKDVRGKILVIKRQEECPYGKLLKFEDNAVFDYDCFRVEDVYKEHKTYKKIKLVEKHLRSSFENDDPSKWYITFNSIAWDPRHHKPYYSAWGAVNVRKPMNKSLRELIEEKGYSNMGMIFLDFYSDHGDKPQLVESIINSNFHANSDEDFIPAE